MVHVKNTAYKKQGQCPFCGKPCKLNAKQCRECRLDQQGKAARKAFFSELRARPCVQCGKPLNSTDRRKIACSNECGYKNRLKEKVDVPCLICGKVVKRYKHAMEKFRGACCSHECQKTWAGRCGKQGPNWHKISLAAKDKWLRARSRSRRVSGWYGAIGRKLFTKGKPAGSWEIAISTRLGSSRGRTCKRPKQIKHSKSIEQAIDKIARKRAWFELPDWYKKIANKLSNATKRRHRKNEVKRLKGCGDTQEDRGVWLQMRFDWVADNRELL